MANIKVSNLTPDTSPTSDDLVATVTDPAGTPASRKVTATNLITKAHGLSDGLVKVASGIMSAVPFPETVAIACSDMTTAITTGTTKAYWVAPWACTLTAVKATLATAGTGTGTTIDINEGAGAGTSVLSTKLTIDVSETDSADAATAAVISDSAIAANGRITIDFDAVGTGAAGVIVYLTVTRAL